MTGTGSVCVFLLAFPIMINVMIANGALIKPGAPVQNASESTAYTPHNVAFDNTKYWVTCEIPLRPSGLFRSFHVLIACGNHKVKDIVEARKPIILMSMLSIIIYYYRRFLVEV